MHRLKNNVNACDLKNCFGFGEDDIDLSIWDTSSIANSTMAPLEFQTNKPYRLALYVRPSERRRLNVTNTVSTVNTNNHSKSTTKKNDSSIMSKFLERSQPKSVKSNRKSNRIMLFDENSKIHSRDTSIKKLENTPEKPKLESSNVLRSINSSRKKVLAEVNTKPVNKTRQYKIRRSYERKCKNDKPELTIEKPSEEIIKEMEMKKLSRTKAKKPTKEEQEFEKWASDINSDFNDVDKFELSIAYD